MPLPSLIDKALDAAILPSFTNIGFALRGLEPVETGMDGRRVVITGATSGLGRSAAATMAGLGATVVLVGRNPDKTAATADAITSAHPRASVSTETANLSLLSEVRSLAGRLNAGPPVDVLVNNAGSLFPERAE
ncbi:MAG: SDR family NAD(P)-dependent oxidoreductase, partial [Acidimicrobiia bacterium]|nr:SDR family NAD(P)-dependent oxidoreductase [Acidimicrobiia bacterium]